MIKRRLNINLYKDIEPQEVLLDSLAKKKEEEMGTSARKFEIPLSRGAMSVFYYIVIVLLFFLLGKVFSMQIIEGDKFSRLADDNRSRSLLYQPIRGVIYDQNNVQLVFNESSFDLVLDKRDLPPEEDRRNTILSEVANIVGKEFNELKIETEKSTEPTLLISKNLSHDKLLVLETKIGQKMLPGFRIDKNIIRNYKDGNVFSHVIGYLGRIDGKEYKSLTNYSISSYVGKMGLEKSYEETLRGTPGLIKVHKDALENIKSEEVVAVPENGNSLVLWLDSELQKKVREALERKLQELGAKKAIGIAVDPKTGGILSMVSLPDFDNNAFQKNSGTNSVTDLLNDPNQPIFNRVISGKYLVGSTIKPLIASAALEEKIIDPKKEIYSPGYIEIPHQYDPEIVYTFKDWTIHGWVDMRKAIAQSSNVYFYSVGGGYKDQKGLGPTLIKEYLKLFGWTDKTGIDLFNEVSGFIPDKEWKRDILKEPWWDGDTYNLSIGQGFVQVTPLEVVTAYAAIANGGTLLKPQIVKQIINTSEENKVIQDFMPQAIRENFIKPEYLSIVREGMRQGVSGYNSPLASSILLNDLPVVAAAKTGTAELGFDHYNNWITVFAPYNNPKIVITLMIENVKGVQAAVLPVAKEILDWYFREEQE